MSTSARYTAADIKEMADNALAKLKRYGVEGLPACYASVTDYLHDFHPNLPWNNQAADAARMIIDNPEFQSVRQTWMDRFNFDWATELTDVIDTCKDEYGIV